LLGVEVCSRAKGTGFRWAIARIASGRNEDSFPGGGQMAVPLDKFVRSLSSSGLMTAEEVETFIRGLPADRQPDDARTLAKEMLRHKKLTRFQIQAVYEGKARGLVLGNYVILDKIGEGGMGQVFKARHRRMERVVALKVLPEAAMSAPEAVQRFQREVKAAARLSHPNIVTAYDADEAGGVHFLVMEYVEGTDLASLVEKRGTLSVDRAVDYVRQAAKGLKYAHGQNVVHRDIKPANLLLDQAGTVKILDLGIARVREEPGAADATADAGLTREGAVMGTVDFMSPEQGLNTKNADARSDVYSLGCTLFWLLVGEPMYVGDTLMAKLLAHREQPVPSLRHLRGDVPPSLDTLFRRMVAKKPIDRQQSMTEVLADLSTCGATKGSSGVRPAPGPRPMAETVDRPATTRTLPPAARPPERLPADARRRQALEKAKRAQRTRTRQAGQKQAWYDAIHDADRDYRRRHGIGFIYRLRKNLGKAVNVVMTIVILGGLLGGTAYAYHVWSRNTQWITDSQTQVVAAVNQQLAARRLDPVAGITFPQASQIRGVPEVLSFQETVYMSANVGTRPVGTVVGQFHRTSGMLEMTIDMTAGRDARGLLFQLKPVPFTPPGGATPE